VQRVRELPSLEDTASFQAPIQAMFTSQRPLTQEHVDIIRPVASFGRFTYQLTATDRTMHWPESFPLANITTSSCANAFLLGRAVRRTARDYV
jgi:hypothetical protein